jgi:hypothetical protein
MCPLPPSAVQITPSVSMSMPRGPNPQFAGSTAVVWNGG